MRVTKTLVGVWCLAGILLSVTHLPVRTQTNRKLSTNSKEAGNQANLSGDLHRR